MPTTRQKRKSAEADDDSSIKSEIPVPAKVKKNESGLKKVSSKNGSIRKTNSGCQRKGRRSNQNTKSEPDSKVEQSESVEIDINGKGVTASGNLKMVSEGKSTGKRKGQKSPAVAVKKKKQDDQKCSKMASSKEQKNGKKDKRNTQKKKVKTESVQGDESEMKKEKETSDTHSVKVEGNNHGQESSSTDSDDAFVDVDADSLSKGLNASELPSARIKQVCQLGNKSIRKTSASKEKKLSTRKGRNIKKSKKKEMNVESAGRSKPYASEQDDSSTENGVKSEHQANLSLMKENDVARVLMHMEGPSAVADGPSTMDNITSSNEKGFSSEESDWEEVEDDPNSHTTPKKSQLPSGPVQIRLDVPDLIKKKRKKKAFDWKIYFNRMLNRFKKALLIDMHKVHLLCLLSHGFHCVRSVRSALIQAQALSLLPTNILKKRPESFDVAALTSLTQWFVGMITVDSQLKDRGVLETVLVERFSRQKVANEKERVLLFFVILCVLRLDTRFIFSVQPLPLKATGKESKGSSLKSKASKSVSENERNRKSKMATSKSKSMNDEAKCSKEGKVAKSDEKSSKYFKNAANCRLKESKTKTLKNNGNPKTDEKPIADAKNIGGKTSKHSKQIESDATVESYDSGPSQRKPRAANKTETDDKPVSDVKNNSGKRSKHSKQIESDATVESYDSGPSQRKPRVANNTETDEKPVSYIKNNGGKRSKHSKPIESDATVESYDSGPSQRKPRAANNTETDEKPVSDIKNNGGKRSKHSKQTESDATVESYDSGPSQRKPRAANNTETDDKPVSDIKNNGGKRSKHSKQIESDATVESCDSGPSKRNLRNKNSQRRSHASKISANKMKQDLDSEDDFEISEEESTDSDCSNYSEEEEVKKRDKKLKSKRATKKTIGSSDSQQSSLDSSQLSSDDFEEEETKFRMSPTYNMKRKYNGGKVSRKVVSSDSDESHSKSSLKIGNDFWLEVFLEADNKWICVDVAHNAVNRPEAMEKSASQPVTYVLGFEKDESVKDVTCRYASQWMSHTRKLRVDSDWWGETLAPYRSKNCDREENEDLLLKAQLTQKPLPQIIGDYKNHPLYALRRHLLKFEAIYPDTAIPLGYVRKEPVYARDCVHTLHSRDNWLKEGRVVKLGETAYKMVKSRPKWNKPKENPDELDLELFGVWQTEIYVPPPAENGKIYKNEYGNIELFKPSMLPAGTVHIRIEGLKKVAKKLDVDCVPAMVGWDHHSGFAHPILDGFVVCEEHEDILLSAWEEEQELQRQREEQKRIKRIYGNWKIIVRGLLIRERLKHRFDLQNSSHIEENKAKAKKGEKATDAAVSWPSNRQQKKGKQQKKSSAAQNCLVEVEQL